MTPPAIAARSEWAVRPSRPPTRSAPRRAPIAQLLLLVSLLALTRQAAAQANDRAPLGSNVQAMLERVRSFNPDLAAAALDSEEAIAKIAPAGALDDPMLNLSRDQGFRQTMFSVSQDFPLWGKRALREGVARANAESAKDRERTVASDLEEQVKVAFAQYYAANRAIGITHDIHSLLHTLAASVQERYARGLGSQSDAIRAQLEQTRLEPELSGLERDEQISKAKINALIARPADAAMEEPSVLRNPPAAQSLSSSALLARAKDQNPMLATARAEIAAADGERKLIDKSYYPDVTVSVGGDDLPNMSPRFVAGIGIKVPLQWGVRKAQERAAVFKRGAAQLRLDGTTLKIESELQSALANLAQAQRTAVLLTSALSPQSEAAYRSALVAYQNGRGDLTAILDAAHQQLRYRLQLLQVQTDQQVALAAIERLIGGDL